MNKFKIITFYEFTKINDLEEIKRILNESDQSGGDTEESVCNISEFSSRGQIENHILIKQKEHRKLMKQYVPLTLIKKLLMEILLFKNYMT